MSKKQDCYHAGARALATVASAIICMYLMKLTNGEHGIGWFAFSLICIW